MPLWHEKGVLAGFGRLVEKFFRFAPLEKSTLVGFLKGSGVFEGESLRGDGERTADVDDELWAACLRRVEFVNAEHALCLDEVVPDVQVAGEV